MNNLTKAFESHGVVLSVETNNDNRWGDCPLCQKQAHFFVHVEKGLWCCKKCGKKGNVHQFFEQIAPLFYKRLKSLPVATSKLAKDRGLSVLTLQAWGVGHNRTHYTIPVSFGGTSDLRRYQIGGRTMSSQGAKVGLVAPLVRPEKPERVWLCEGEWDGMTFWEAIGAERRGRELVLAVTGAGSFPTRLAHLFQNLPVNILFDNDEPGQEGALRTGSLLEGVASEIQYLRWPPGLAIGFDVRDLFKKDRKGCISFIEQRLTKSKPGEEITVSAVVGGSSPDETKKGRRVPHDKVLTAFRKWLLLKEDESLDVLFGSVFANRLGSDPLWIFFVGPPGSCKTELLNSLSTAHKVMHVTGLTPQSLVSGMNFAGGEDPSLVPRLNGKVLVIEDFTTILSMQAIARDEIFGVLRAVYGGKFSKTFGNGVTRNYKSQFGILAGVTHSIESFGNQSSVLGERFIKYRFRAGITFNERKAVVRRALQNLAHEVAMREELMAQSGEVLAFNPPANELPKMGDSFTTRVIDLANWVAQLRGVVSREKYTREMTHRPIPELGTRLAKQFSALGMGIAVYLGEREMTEKGRMYKTISRVARDTAPSRVEEVVRQLFMRRKKGFLSNGEIAEYSSLDYNTTCSLMQDLELLDVVRKEDPKKRGHWALTDSMLELTEKIAVYHNEGR